MNVHAADQQSIGGCLKLLGQRVVARPGRVLLRLPAREWVGRDGDRGEPVPGAAAGGLPEASSMKVRELKAELEARGVPTATLLEKVEFVEALQRARREGRPR